MRQDLHGMMKVTKKTVDADSIFSYVGKIFDNEVVEAGKRIKPTADGQQKRGKKIGKVNMTKIPCEEEGCGKTFTLKSNLKRYKDKKKPINNLHEIQPEDNQTMVDEIKAAVDEIVEVAVMKAGEKKKSIDEKKKRRKYFQNKKARIFCKGHYYFFVL